MDHTLLIERWQSRAADMERWGCPVAARIWNAAADELEVFAREHALEELTLAQAAAESGYSVAHLGRMIKDRKVENAGTKGAPLMRRDDLPKKPSRNRQLRDGEPDLAGEILNARLKRGPA